ncbi:MAG: antitoxin [Deltaproteobacteria bacterium]|nr:antitoxin [Deltaproteobacteria bacterium]
MTRTTIDIDDPVLQELKALQKKRGRSLGKIASQLLAEALAQERAAPAAAPRLQWISRPMGALVDLADKEALYTVLDRDEP